MFESGEGNGESNEKNAEPSKQEIKIVREFDAPRELVFHTDAITSGPDSRYVQEDTRPA